MALPQRRFPAATSLIAILSIATATAAQTARTPGAVVQEPQPDVASLLKSRDPRQQAWGAWYAGVGQLRHVAPLLQELVRDRLRTQTSWDATLDVAMDALIQLKAPLDPELLPELYALRPDQAVIAASLAAGDESNEFLRDLVRTASGHNWFAAANLLLERSPRLLARDLLPSLRLKVKVYLVDHGHMMGGGESGGVGVGCGGGGLAPGMPPWPTYALTSFPHAGVTVVAMGPTPIYYRRTVSPAGQGPRASVTVIGGPTGDDRLAYVAAGAGIEPTILPLRGYEQYSVSVRAGGSLDSELTRIRTDLSQRFQRFMAMLVERDIVRADVAATHLPQIDFDIEDHRRTSSSVAPGARSQNDAANRFPPSQRDGTETQNQSRCVTSTSVSGCRRTAEGARVWIVTGTRTRGVRTSQGKVRCSCRCRSRRSAPRRLRWQPK